MKTYHFLLICLIAMLSSCVNTAIDEVIDDAPQSRAANSDCTFFMNLSSTNSGSSISGDIYCSEDTEYTFIFVFGGSGTYRATIGDQVLAPDNGSDFRNFTLKLKAGYTHCSVTVTPNSGGQVYARLLIDAVNGDKSMNCEGCLDLVAMGSIVRSATQSRAVNSDYSYFINVSPSNGGERPYISGDIYCAQDATYSFTFGFDGDGDYTCRIGDMTLTPRNGESLRKFTVNLKAGYTPCSVFVSSTTTKYAYGRLVITAINGDTGATGVEGDYIDLVAFQSQKN